jgi:hypothetical protein
MSTKLTYVAATLAILLSPGSNVARAQEARQPIAGQRGFIEGTGVLYPRDTPIDGTNVVGDLLMRDEGFVKPLSWLQFAGGIDLRANSHDQVESSWRLDFRDRGELRPRLAVRRLTATVARGPLTLDIGKQFIRWGKTDIVTPTDRFAPRDFINVVDNEFLAVTGARAVLQRGANSIDVAWVPWMTPSRTPLLDQRWTSVPNRPALPLVDGGSEIPGGAQTGVRVAHTGAAYELAATFFDGFNHLPNIVPAPVQIAPGVVGAVSILKTYPTLRLYGVDAALPTKWFTLKSEAAYFTTTTAGTDEYVIYTIQIERQTGEWMLVGGYAGQALTEAGRTADAFAPDRGLTKAFVGRASYTIDPNRDAAIEAAIRQNGDGMLLKGEFSQARGQHWRATVSAALIRGEPDDFFGQYRLNSHATLALRYSF